MRRIRMMPVALAAALAAGVAGCGEKPAPKAVSAESIPSTTAALFKTAPAEVKQEAEALSAAIAREDYTTAWEKVQALSARPNLSGPQREFVGQCMVTVGQHLQQADASGDPKAAQMLELHRTEK